MCLDKSEYLIPNYAQSYLTMEGKSEKINADFGNGHFLKIDDAN